MPAPARGVCLPPNALGCEAQPEQLRGGLGEVFSGDRRLNAVGFGVGDGVHCVPKAPNALTGSASILTGRGPGVSEINIYKLII